MARFTEFINFVETGSCFELEDLSGMFSGFLTSMSSTNISRKGEIRFSQKFLTKSIVLFTTKDYIVNRRVPTIFEFTFNV